MINAIPLFYYPTTCIYVDDDKTFLQCMPMAFENIARSKLFSSAKACIDFLGSYKTTLSFNHFLKSNCDDEHYGVLHHTPTDFDITAVAELSNNPARHDEITAMVIDYHMPEMNGFSLAKECGQLPVNKILLTGTTDDEHVIAGFNQSVIQRFVQKNEEMEEKLASYLSDLSLQYFQTITSPLLAHLEVENRMPLSDPVFIAFFKSFCLRKNIVEYYLIDKQGSFLCIDHDGKKTILILHSDRSLDAWVEAYGSGDELPQHLLQAIQRREKIPFFGIGKEAWNIDSAQWKNYFYSSVMLVGRERYFWFELEG